MGKRLFINLLIFINLAMYLIIAGLWVILIDQLMFCSIVTLFNMAMSCLIIIWDKERFAFLYQSEQFKKLSIHTINAVLVFFIVGLLNYLAFKNPIQWDFTSRRSNSLTVQTEQVLASLDKKVRFTVFARKIDFGSFHQLLELFKFRKTDIEISFVDIELSPHLVQKYNITRANSILVEYGEKNLVVDEVDELHLVNALVRLSKRNDPLIGIVSGHSEISWDEDGKDGMSFLKRQLQNNNYIIRDIKLGQISKLPEELSALVIWGPKEGFFDLELKMIKEYIERGGKVLIGIDPQLNQDKLAELRKLLENYGIKVRNNLVIDRLKSINGSNGTVPLVEKLNLDHPVTKGIENVFFPLVSSIEINQDQEGIDVLAETTPFPASWADANPSELLKGQITFNEGKDLRGPVGLAASVDLKEKGSRLIVFGTSNFVLNSYNRFAKNFNLFLNSLAWLVGADELISFNIPSLKDEPVFISGTKVNSIFYFSVVFAPLILFFLAIYFYRRRSLL